MILKDQAVVLKSIDFQDTSKIIGVLTKEHGKISIIAKGAKNPKSKYAGILQIGNVLEILFYHKDSREIQVLTDASFIVKAYPIHFNMDKLAVLMPTLEMIDQLVSEKAHSGEFFDFAQTYIKWLILEEKSVSVLFPYILVRLAELSGIQLSFESTYEASTTYFLNGSDGNITEIPESGLSIKLLPNQALYLFLACNKLGKRLQLIPFDTYELKNLIHHLDVYFRQHIEGLRDRKSDDIFNGM